MKNKHTRRATNTLVMHGSHHICISMQEKTHSLRKGQSVVYRPRLLDFDVSAVVRTRHRDNTVTVEARHVLDDNGKPQSGYLGYRYRTPVDCVRPTNRRLHA